MQFSEIQVMYNKHVKCLLSVQTCEQRQVSHFQYLSWPDYGVPTSAVTLIDFLGAVKRQQRKMVKALGFQWTGHPQGPPMVVHCSAGIGRTGKIQRLYSPLWLHQISFRQKNYFVKHTYFKD